MSRELSMKRLAILAGATAAAIAVSADGSVFMTPGARRRLAAAGS